MATILNDISRTFSEYLLIPRLTRKGQVADKIGLGSPLSAVEKGSGTSLLDQRAGGVSLYASGVGYEIVRCFGTSGWARVCFLLSAYRGAG